MHERIRHTLRRWRGLFGTLLLVFLVTAGAVERTNDDNAVSPTRHTDPVAVDPALYSDDVFRALLEKYAADDGESVDYEAWQANDADMAAMDRQVALVASVSPKSDPELFPTRDAERRYWINTYNMLVIDAVLDYWPIDSVKGVRLSLTSRVLPGKGFFYDRKVIVGGETTNLLKLEKAVLRTQRDPRLHFALNCGSESCPVIRPSDWSDAELEQAARDFINDPANVTVEGDAVYLSEIFKWYRRDFPRDIYGYLATYANPNLAEALAEASANDYAKRYRSYDWSLNDRNDEELADDGN
jgi:hypothetical protein